MTSICAGHCLARAPTGIEPATPSLPFVSSLPYREAVQVKVTRMTVADREDRERPSVMAPSGTAGEDDRSFAGW